MIRIVRLLTISTLMLFGAASSMAQVVANFTATPTTGCSPVTVCFTNTSTGNYTSSSWTFTPQSGSALTTGITNPCYTFTSPQTYTITLTVSGPGGTDTKTVNDYIVIGAPPVVAFTASDTTDECAPKTVTYNSTVTANASGPVDYLWDFGDGQSSVLADPTHTYVAGGPAGPMNVSLKVTNSAGCQTVITKNNLFTLFTPPVANFGSFNNITCGAPATVTFTNNPDASVTYSWNFGDGTGNIVDNNTQVNHTYANAGTYTVVQTATSAGGCSNVITKTNFVTIGLLSGGFQASATSVCPGTTVTFTDTTNNNTGGSQTTAYYIAGSPTAFANTANAARTFSAPGTYQVLQVVAAGSCTDSNTVTITVQAPPVLTFTADDNYNCSAPFTVNFTYSATGAGTGAEYSIAYGQGTPDTFANSGTSAHTYTATGNFNPVLTVETALGCITSLPLAGGILIATPAATITSTVDSGCAGINPCFTAATTTGTITGYSWDFGDMSPISTAANPCHTYSGPAPATYTVTLTYTVGPGCTGTVTKIIKVGTQPVASFTTSIQSFPGLVDTICSGTAVTLTNTSTGTTATSTKKFYYLGNVSGSALGTATNTSGNYTYNSLGQFTPAIVVGNAGCLDTAQHIGEIFVKGSVANFTFTYDCANRLNFTFTSTSTGIPTGGLFTWAFCDGGTATGNVVTHTFPAYAACQVTLTVYDSLDNCTSTKTISVTPTTISALFTATNTNICNGGSVSVTASNTTNMTYTYQWGDGDSSVITGADGNTTHTYDDPGTYSIQLTVKDSKGCTISTTQNNIVTVHGPVISFSASDTTACTGATINFTGTATSAGTTIASSQYNFGDGTLTPGLNASHVFDTGLHTVTLKVTDNLMCTDSVTKTDYISVLPIPVASFYTNDTGVCPGAVVTFISTSQQDLTHHWDFGDTGVSDTSNLLIPTYTYNTPGLYTISLTVSNAIGCSATTTIPQYINVYDIQAAFTMSDSFATCPPLTVNFTNQSQFANQYLWEFGNGNSASTTNPSTTYTYADSFVVKLTAISNQGCKDSVFHAVVVGGPTGQFVYTTLNGCAPFGTTLQVLNTNASVVTFDTRDFVTTTVPVINNTATLPYNYANCGQYVPIVTLSDGQSCNYALLGADTIKVDRPIGGFYFTGDSSCQYQDVSFFDTSTGCLYPIAGRTWYFDYGVNNSLTSTQQNPVFSYTTPGVHAVLLVSTSSFGCTDSTMQNVFIKTNPIISVSPANPAVCLNDSVQLVVNGAGTNATYFWQDPGAQTLSDPASGTPFAFPSVTTTYTVYATSQNGCADTASKTVIVNPLPVITASGDTSICFGQSTTLIGSGAGAGSYEWIGPNILGNPNQQAITVAPASNTAYIVTGTTIYGCKGTASINVIVTPLPQIITQDPGPICRGDTAQLYAQNPLDPNTVFTWTPSNPGLISCSACDSPLAYPTVTTVFYVNAFANGCAANDTVTVVVNQLPSVYAGPDVTICSGDSALLTASGASNYFWMPTPLSCDTCASTYAFPSGNTVYTVTGVDANNCVNKDSVLVSVINRVPTAVAATTLDICRGDSVQLNATGGLSYVWTPTTYLSDANIPNPIAFPDATTTYTVLITENQCFVDTFYVTVNVNPIPSINLGPDVTLYGGESIQLNTNPMDATVYTWTPANNLSCTDCAFPIANPTVTTTYVLVASNQFGCVASDTITIFVKCDSLIYFPNTFTPNGDGQNDLFYPRARGTVTIKSFKIYSRWGELVFERSNVLSNDINYGWDGTFKGIPSKPDVFIYTADFECLDGTAQRLQGDISLLR